MRRIRRIIAGSAAIVALLSISGLALAQSVGEQGTTQDPMPMTSPAPMAGVGGYCLPGCIVPPMPGQGMMHQGQMPMMGQGMMHQGQMPMMGQGMMHQGQMPMMGQGMMGQGMMHQGQMPMMGQGMMMASGMGHFLVRDLTTDEVRHIIEHRLVAFGLPGLKVDAVEETNDETITVDVVTAGGILAQRLSVDRHTGMVTPIE